jgi:serine/threonine-protein kinase
MGEPPLGIWDGLAGRYTLERELGRGGMATVFLAQDVKHDRPVALKVLHPELAASLGPERFQREIRLAARLQHPHILTVLDSGETAGNLWFTMPFVDGESLRSRLSRERQLPVEDALQIAREAAQALQYAHVHGVIHRDVKPENLLLTRDGHTLVADFGIARALSGAAAESKLTGTGFVVGTPAYMSPEQAGGDPGLDARTDVYSLGAVLFEMLAGEPPYTGATVQALLVKRMTEPAPSVRAVRVNVPEAVDAAIRKALAPVPADRHATMAQFGQALQRPAGVQAEAPTAASVPASATTPTSHGPAAPSDRGSRRVPALALTLVLGILIGLGVLFAWRRSHSDARDDGPAGPRIIAVLPFENLGDSSTAYFADGITDAVRGKLSSVPGLQVIASQSSNEYRRTTKSLTEIGRELDADYLLIARVRWAVAPDGTRRVEVSPELVEAAPGRPPTTRWQQPFEAAVTDVFQVQGDIATKVVSALDIALGAAQREVLSEKPTANLAAYEAFLKGEAAVDWSVTGAAPLALRRAIGLYGEAVALDSTFVQAWSQLARAQAYYYYTTVPDPALGESARRAAERAAALRPGRPESQLALGDYHLNVKGATAAALAAYETGLEGAPDNAELLTGAALAEQTLGRWDAALGHLERAQALDPRSTSTVRRLGHTLLRLRRYPEALAASERGLVLAPTSLDMLENLTMVYLGQGNLPGAQAALQAGARQVQPADLVTFFGNYWDLYWVLDDAQQRLLLRLPPSAFADDRAAWAIVLTQTLWLRGDRRQAMAFADSARVEFERNLQENSDDPQRRALLALVLAYLGRKTEAIREGERAVALMPASRDGYAGPYLQHVLARIYLLAGEPDKAIDQLEALLKTPYLLSPGWLRVDPTFEPLRNHPRFRKLVEGTE